MSDDTRETEAAEREIQRLRRYETALTNIAFGYWNAGRENPISASDYAKQALADTLRPRLDPDPLRLRSFS